MTMIETIKVTLVRGRYCEADWAANIELDEETTLEELHNAIQTAVGFEHDHMFTFYLSRTDDSQKREYLHDEDYSVVTKTIKEVFPLPEKQSLFYMFDWGDEWVFKISKTRKGLQPALPGVTYPRVESESGIKPDQYPSYDDDYDEEDDEDE